MRVLSFAVLSAAFAFTPVVGWASVWYVAPTGDDGNAGSAEKPFATINCAIVSAAEGDEIRIQAGTYVENVRNVAAEGGKNGLQFRGGYAADWTRDLKTQKTVVKAANAVQTVFYVNTKANLLNGLTLTGGKYGYECATADSGKFQYLYQCVISNNTERGVYLSSACKGLVASCLFYKNVVGVWGTADKSNAAYFYNCTFAGHTNAALYHGDEEGRVLYAYNCAFDDNKYHVWHNWVYTQVVYSYDCCFGRVKTGGRSADGKGNNGTLSGWSNLPGLDLYFGNSMYRDVRLNADFTLADGSWCIKRGVDQSANAVFVYDEDLVGNKWGGAWDMGCFKSASALVALPDNSDSYASPAGDDANSGLDAEHPKKTVLAALNLLGENGVCHLQNGTYTEQETGFVHRPGIKVVGESREGVVVKSTATASPNVLNGCFYVNASSVVISNMTLVGGSCGIAFGCPPVASNSVVSHCSISNCNYGVFARAGAAKYPGNVVRISKCLLKRNSYGARLHAPCVMDNCLIVDSTGYDGVFYRVDASLGGTTSELINCTVMGNSRNGVILCNDGIEQCNLVNCVIASNKSYGVDRSMPLNYHKYPWLYNCAFSGNASGTVRSSTSVGERGLYDLMYPDDLGFNDPKAGPYVPGLGSPLVKAGTADPTLVYSFATSDIDDYPRKGRRPDVGCYQHRYVKGLGLLIR